MPLMGWVAANLLIGGQQPIPLGNENFTAAPSSMFRTQDGFINIAANQQQQWEDLADVLGVPELKTDPRFQERDTRKANRYVLGPLLEARLMQETTAHWVEVLNARGIPAGDVLSLEAALNSEQARHREVIAEVEQPELGSDQDLQPDRQVLGDAGRDREPAAASLRAHRGDSERTGLFIGRAAGT